MTMPSRRTWLRIGLGAMLAAALYPPWDFVIKNQFEPTDSPAETDSAEVMRHAALWSPPRMFITVTDTVVHEVVTTSWSRARIDFGVLTVTWAAVVLGTALLTTFASASGPGRKEDARSSSCPPEPSERALRE